MRTDLAGQRGTGLVDLLDRVLDKGLLMGIDLITVEARPWWP